MRIAVTYENGDIFQHFGHSTSFKVYEVEEGKIKSTSVENTNGSGHGALVGVLKALRIDALICGGIGGGARNALSESGIKLYGGVSGNADEAVEALLGNRLSFNSEASCNHHGEHHHGDCGNHGEHHGNCGRHGCGSNC